MYIFYHTTTAMQVHRRGEGAINAIAYICAQPG